MTNKSHPHLGSADTKAPEIAFGRSAYTILAVALVVVVVILCLIPSPENDLFWQLRAGMDILNSHKISHVDSYSWTRHGSPWISYGWLSFVLFWAAYSAGNGYAGLFILKGIVTATTSIILFRHLCWASKGKVFPAAIITAAAALSVSVGFMVSPNIFTYLLLTLVGSTIMRLRSSGYSRDKVWWLLPIFVLWANLHPGVAIALLLLTLWSIGDLIDGACSPDHQEQATLKQRGWHLAIITLGCLIATFITPFGISELRDILANMQLSNGNDVVSLAPSPTLHTSAGLVFFGLIGILSAGLLFTKRSIPLGDIAVFIVLLHGGLLSEQYIPAFALVGTMISAPYLFELLKFPSTTVVKQESLRTAIVLGMVIITVGSLDAIKSVQASSPTKEPISSALSQLAKIDFNTTSEPVLATRFLTEANFPETWKMYNDYGQGGYYIWYLPTRPVSIDSRRDVYSGSVLNDYSKVHQGSFDWKAAFDRHPADFVVCSASTGEARVLMNSLDWALVYAPSADMDAPAGINSTENSLIFVRRSPEMTAKIREVRLQCPTLVSPLFLNGYSMYPAVR